MTRKVIGDPTSPLIATDNFIQKSKQAIQAAGWAPFHYPATTSDGPAIEPWRFYACFNEGRQQILRSLSEKQSSSQQRVWQEQGKIPALIAGAGAAIFITYLPEPTEGVSEEKAAKSVEINAEHLAATAAATQNLLLAAEALGMWTYWSSGGLFRTDAGKELVGIPTREHLVAIAFLAPPQESATVAEGKLREKRSPVDGWCKVISNLPQSNN